MIAPFLNPLDYSRDFILYLEAFESTIGNFLVQEDDSQQENVIHYLIWAHADIDLSYDHVKKLAIVLVDVVQQLRHYLVLRKTLVVTNLNPFQYILTHCLIGGRFSRWIVIL